MGVSLAIIVLRLESNFVTLARHVVPVCENELIFLVPLYMTQIDCDPSTARRSTSTFHDQVALHPYQRHMAKSHDMRELSSGTDLHKHKRRIPRWLAAL